MSIKQNNKYKRLASNTLLFALGNFGSKFLVFFLLPLYTNVLTTTEYGISELVSTTSNLLMPFVILSIQDATMRFGLDTRCDKGEVARNSIIVLTIGSIITIILYPIFSLYKPFSGYVSYFVCISITNMIRTVFSMYIKAIGKTTIFAIDSIVNTAVLLILNIVFLTTLKLGLDGYFLAIIISSILSILFLSISGRIIKTALDSKNNWDLMKEMLRFSIPMVLNNVSWWIINSSDRIMIEYFYSAAESGIYSVAAKMPSVLVTITNIFNQAWTISSISEYDTTRDEQFYSTTFSVYNCTLLIISSAIILIIKPFMQVYVGKDFISCWQYVPLLILGSVFQSYANFFGAIYTSAKKNVSIMLTTSLAAFINIALNCLLIPTIGIQGAVIATAVAYFVVFIIRMIDSKKYVDFKINYVNTLFTLCLLTIQCLVTILDVFALPISLLCMLITIICNKYSILRILRKVKLYKK